MADIKVYGADWCPLTRNTLRYLQSRGVPFEYIDVEKNPEASEWVKQQNGGKEKKPTVDIDGQVLSEPTDQEVAEALSSSAR